MISRNHFTVLHALYRHNEQQEPGRHSTGSTQEARQGHIELWEKWSWTGNAVEDVKRAANSLPEKWIVVEKSRIERKFVFDGKAVREIDAKAKHPGNACNVEITSLRVQGQ